MNRKRRHAAGLNRAGRPYVKFVRPVSAELARSEDLTLKSLYKAITNRFLYTSNETFVLVYDNPCRPGEMAHTDIGRNGLGENDIVRLTYSDGTSCLALSIHNVWKAADEYSKPTLCSWFIKDGEVSVGKLDGRLQARIQLTEHPRRRMPLPLRRLIPFWQGNGTEALFKRLNIDAGNANYLTYGIAEYIKTDIKYDSHEWWKSGTEPICAECVGADFTEDHCPENKSGGKSKRYNTYHYLKSTYVRHNTLHGKQNRYIPIGSIMSVFAFDSWEHSGRVLDRVLEKGRAIWNAIDATLLQEEYRGDAAL